MRSLSTERIIPELYRRRRTGSRSKRETLHLTACKVGRETLNRQGLTDTVSRNQKNLGIERFKTPSKRYGFEINKNPNIPTPNGMIEGFKRDWLYGTRDAIAQRVT
jgi:hypothetical protein